MTNATETQHVTCPRCDGKGRIDGFGHVASGRCFLCGGAGSIEVDRPDAADLIRMRTARAWTTAEIALEAAFDGNFSRAAFYARAVADDLRTVGTENARDVLARVAQGRFYCPETDQRLRVSRDDAAMVRSMIIEAGRAKAVAA